ncbi:MAG: hypothetical protein AAFW75_06580 [Cyanobacteria bacterium J06636_16]
MAASPYRSKVLRLVLSHVRQIRRQTIHTWRWAKLRTVWGVQRTIAIAHATWYWSQNQWRQIAHSARAMIAEGSTPDDSPQSSPLASQGPAADTPICQVLAWADTSLPTAIACQGFATDLATGRLAWVTSNAIVVLDNETHASLHKQITLRFSEYDAQQPLGQPQTLLTRHSERMHGARILAWIWQAIAYFFGAGFGGRNHRCVEPVCFSGEPAPMRLPGQSALAFTLLPGVWHWGSTFIVWMRRAISRWVVGQQLAHGQQNTSLQQAQMPAIAAFRTSPKLSHSQPRTVDFQVITRCPDIITITVSTSAGTTETWLEVPAVVVGYERSFLVQLLTALDWLFEKLERWFAEIWRRVKIYLAL